MGEFCNFISNAIYVNLEDFKIFGSERGLSGC